MFRTEEQPLQPRDERVAVLDLRVEARDVAVVALLVEHGHGATSEADRLGALPPTPRSVYEHEVRRPAAGGLDELPASALRIRAAGNLVAVIARPHRSTKTAEVVRVGATVQVVRRGDAAAVDPHHTGAVLERLLGNVHRVERLSQHVAEVEPTPEKEEKPVSDLEADTAGFDTLVTPADNNDVRARQGVLVETSSPSGLRVEDDCTAHGCRLHHVVAAEGIEPITIALMRGVSDLRSQPRCAC